MKLNRWKWLFSCCCLLSLNALATQWQVEPTTCVSEKAGIQCTLTLTLNIQTSKTQDYCLRFAGQNIGCWPADNLPTFIEVSLIKRQDLELTTKRGKVLLTKTIDVKTLQAKLRRRVRDPWSLF